jgi:hypothetical protein
MSETGSTNADSTKPAPAAARRVAKIILTLTVLIAVALVAYQVGRQLSARWSLFDCLEGLPDIEDTTVRVVASFILFALVAAQFWVHAQDENVQNRPEDEDGVKGRYKRLREQAAPVPPAHAPLGGQTLTPDGVAAAVAHGIALAKEKEKHAAGLKLLAARFHETDKSAIRAFMTKQAIFAAITLALLKAVSTRLPSVFPGNFKELLYVMAAGGFLVTLLIVLAAIQTYSTYVRIQWDDASGIALLRKGREFDEHSFYWLTCSLLVALCAYQPWAALIAMPVFGRVMYRYYFFRP